MFKLVAVGIWVMMVTAGATMASAYLGRVATVDSAATEDLGMEEITSDMTSIPIIRGGDVAGYLILQLSFAADKALLEQKKVDPLPFMRDAAFRTIFTSNDVDFRRLKSGDLNKLTEAIASEANRRLGMKLVRQVLLQQLNYVKKEDIRTNWIGGGPVGN